MGLNRIIIRIIIMLAVAFTSQHISGQASKRADSLVLELKKASDPRIKIGILHTLSNHFQESDPQKAISFSREAYKLASEIKDIKQMITALNAQSLIYYSLSDLKNAMETAKQAKSLAQEKKLKAELADILYGIGLIYYEIGDKSKSSGFYFESLKLFEQTKDNIGISKALSSIGILYAEQKNYDQAIEYLNKSLSITRKENHRHGIASLLNNIANTYLALGEDSKAIVYLNEALLISKELKNKNLEGSVYVNLGKAYFHLEKYSLALHYQQRGLSLFIQTRNLNRIAICHNNISEIYFADKKYDLGIKNSEEALKISLEHGFKQSTFQSAHLLHNIYLEKKDTLTAYKYSILEGIWKDSLALSEKEKNLASLELKYHFEKREQDELIARQRRTVIAFIVIGFLVLGIIIILLILNQLRLRAKKSRLEKESLEKELDFKKKELTLNVMSLMKQNEMLSDISKKIIQIENDTQSQETKEALKKVGKEVQRSTEQETLKEFSLRFKEIHKDFYDALIRKYPELTPSDLRLCAFLRLNMTSKEISELTGQQLTTLENARYRLRQKLGITNSDVNLVTFLAQI